MELSPKMKKIPPLALNDEQKQIIEQVRRQALADKPQIVEEARRIKAAEQVSGVQLRSAFRLLQAIRKNQGMSLTALAAATGITKASLSRLEHNPELNVTLTTVTRVAEALGCDLRITVAPRIATGPTGPTGPTKSASTKPSPKPRRAKT